MLGIDAAKMDVICDSEYQSFLDLGYAELRNLQSVTEKEVDGLSVAIWKDVVGEEIRIVVQVYHPARGFLGRHGLGSMAYRGFLKAPDGAVRAVPQDDLWEFS